MKVVNRTSVSVAAMTVIGVTAGGIAYADSQSTPASTSTTSATHQQASSQAARHNQAHSRRANGRLARRGGRRLAARALHGEVVVGGKNQQRTIDVQKGEVTSVSSTSLTMKSVDGYTKTYVITSATRVRSKRKPSSISNVKPGERAFVVARKNGDTATARVVLGVRRPKPAKSGAASGSTSG